MAGYKNFNFMFFVFDGDFYKTLLHEAACLNNFRAMSFVVDEKNFHIQPMTFPNNPFAFSNKKNYSTWSNHFFADDFPVKNPLCFVIYEGFYIKLKAINFFEHLRENYRGCKLVLWVNNPIRICQNIRGMFVDKADTEEILSTFDLVFTYNQKDAMDYGLTYFEGPYSVLPFEPPREDVDIFFVGLAKDRLKKILRAYETFKAAGFVCEFFINGLSAPPSIKADDLHFNEYYLPYSEVVRRVLRSRAVLDICTAGTYGLTPRYFESLAYDKIFITDCAFYRQKKFTSPKLFLIDRSLDIDREKFMAASKLPNTYRNEYSPLRLITFLESVLNA